MNAFRSLSCSLWGYAWHSLMFGQVLTSRVYRRSLGLGL